MTMAKEKSKGNSKTGADALLMDDRVIIPDTKGDELFTRGVFGVKHGKKLTLSLTEALFLAEKEKLIIKNRSGRVVSVKSLIKAGMREESNFWTKYLVFKDLRDRGYVVKTALKFGADFRVYDRGIKPGEDHAKWIVYPVKEGSTLTWNEFSAKNRVAHSTKKRLMIAVVDEEDDVSYWEVRWIRP